MPAVGRLWPSDDDDEDRDDADATDVDDGGLLLVGCPPSKRIKLILFHPYCTQPSFSRKHLFGFGNIIFHGMPFYASYKPGKGKHSTELCLATRDIIMAACLVMSISRWRRPFSRKRPSGYLFAPTAKQASVPASHRENV